MGTERMENQMEEEIWLVEYKDHFTHLITEGSLGGKKRGGGTGRSNWDAYVVDDFDKNKKYEMFKDTQLVNDEFEEIKSVKQGDDLQILSPKIKQQKRSQYANVSIGGKKGFVKINTIRKPIPVVSPFIPLGELNPAYTGKIKIFIKCAIFSKDFGKSY